MQSGSKKPGVNCEICVLAGICREMFRAGWLTIVSKLFHVQCCKFVGDKKFCVRDDEVSSVTSVC